MVSAYTLLEGEIEDYCTLYFIVLVTDGVVVNFLSLTFYLILQNLSQNFANLKFRSGNYNEEQILASWLYQLGIWT